MLLAWSELPESAKDKVESLPRDAKKLYFAARDLVYHEQNFSALHPYSHHETVFWTQLEDAIESIEGIEPENSGGVR